MKPITTAAGLVSIMSTDPSERVVCTYSSEGGAAAWHLMKGRREVAGEVVRDLLAFAELTEMDDKPCLIPQHDGLLPGVSQTFRFSVTSQNSSNVQPDDLRIQGRKRGRPPRANAPTDAERKAKSRARQERREVHTLLLVAAMTDQLPSEALARLMGSPAFGPIIKHARLVARAVEFPKDVMTEEISVTSQKFSPSGAGVADPSVECD